VGEESGCSERLWEEFCEKVNNYMQPFEQDIGSIESNVNTGSVGLILRYFVTKTKFT
jgi:hypothetical protein